VECTEVLPATVSNSHLVDGQLDGLDFFYSLQNNSLRCNIRFSKISVTNEDVATCRIPNADVVHDDGSVSAYVGAIFMYNDETYEVTAIHNNVAQCRSMYNEQQYVEIALDVVNGLVDNIGN
jgi:hypothetical protein